MTSGADQGLPALPTLPANARYFSHAPGTTGWGILRAGLEGGWIDVERFSYYMVVTSAVRGPFLPSYWPVPTCPQPACLACCGQQLPQCITPSLNCC